MTRRLRRLPRDCSAESKPPHFTQKADSCPISPLRRPASPCDFFHSFLLFYLSFPMLLPAPLVSVDHVRRQTTSIKSALGSFLVTAIQQLSVHQTALAPTKAAGKISFHLATVPPTSQNCAPRASSALMKGMLASQSFQLEVVVNSTETMNARLPQTSKILPTTNMVEMSTALFVSISPAIGLM